MSGERLSNRLARVILGVAFAVVAFVLEWRVVKAIKKGQLGPKKPAPSGLAAAGTADGLKVTPDE
jgi:hypothetical protein